MEQTVAGVVAAVNLYFNDLTVDQRVAPALNIQALHAFARLFYRFSRETGEQHVWAPRELKNYFRSLPWDRTNMTLWQWVNGTFSMKSDHTPSEDEAVENRYYTSTFTVDVNGTSVRCDHMGLAALTKPAEVSHSLTLGFADGGFWSRLYHVVTETPSNGAQRTHDTLCATEPSHLDVREAVDWRQVAYPVALPECEDPPQSKVIHFRDDHGNDVLEDFAKRLVRSRYVVGVVNSLGWKPHAQNFVEECRPDGIVHLRLHWEDRGLGLAVQTSGMTLDQTERIARILCREYER